MTKLIGLPGQGWIGDGRLGDPTARRRRLVLGAAAALLLLLVDLEPKPAELIDLEDRLGWVCDQLVRAGGRADPR
jgi:hypothetical protein